MNLSPAPSRPASLPALLALAGAFSLAACGGRGGASEGPAPAFSSPATDVHVAVGAPVPVALTGFAPASDVFFVLDEDGDPDTAFDAHPIAQPLTTGPDGGLAAFVETDGAPPGTYHLLAVPAGGGPAVAAPGLVGLEDVTLLRGVGGVGTESLFQVAALSGGRIAVAGRLDGTSDFAQAGMGPVTLSSGGSFDAFLSFLGKDGTIEHAWTIGGPGIEDPYTMSVDASGGVAVGGFFDDAMATAGSVPGPVAGTVPKPNGDSGFAARYGDDASEQSLLVAEPFPNQANAHVYVVACAQAGDGGRYVVVSGNGNVVVGDVVSSDLGAAGSTVVRVDAAGTPVGAFHAILGDAYVVGMAACADGDLLVGGSRMGDVTFAPGKASAAARTSPSNVPFVARFHPDGTLVSLLDPLQPGWADVYGFAALPDGRCWLVGTAYEPVEFAPMVGFSFVPGVEARGYVVALDAGLVAQWTQTWVGGGPVCASVAGAPDGSCVVAGYVSGSFAVDDLNLDPFPGFEDDTNGYVMRCGPQGEIRWVVSVAGPGGQRLWSTAIAADGAVLVAGQTDGACIAFDRDQVARPITLLGGNGDGLLLRLAADGRFR